MKETDFVNQIVQLCNGSNMPDERLYTTGKFPEGWVDSYLKALKENRSWQGMNNWPREVSYCFYRIGFHLNYAYQDWSIKNDDTNPKTEEDLNKIRLFTESFLTGSSSDEWVL
jgi:hypothetical protein